MDDLGIVEAADDLEEGIDGPDVGQESVTKTSTGRGTTGKTGDIVDGQVSGDLGGWLAGGQSAAETQKKPIAVDGRKDDVAETGNGAESGEERKRRGKRAAGRQKNL